MCDLIPCALIGRTSQTSWSHGYDTKHGVPWHLNSKKLKNISKSHETLLDVRSCHQDDVVKNFGMFDKSLDTHPSQTGATH